MGQGPIDLSLLGGKVNDDNGFFRDYHYEIEAITIFWHLTSQISLQRFSIITQNEIIISSDKSCSMIRFMKFFQIWFSSEMVAA